MNHGPMLSSGQGNNGYLTAAFLLLATLLSQLLNPIYQAFEAGQSPVELLLPSLLFLALFTLPAIAIGLLLGKKLNLGVINVGQERTQGRGMLWAILLGVVLGAILLLLRQWLLPYLPPEIPEYGFRGPLGGLLVSIGAAVGEEVWFRYGLMTLLFFVACKLTMRDQLSHPLALGIIVFVAVGFGLAHLPQLTSFGVDSTFAIWATILGNTAVGTLYGWCYWRYGLLCAITAHFSVDLVLHVLPAF